MIAREAALSGSPNVSAHTTHTNQPLRLQCWSPLSARGTVRAALAVASKVERAIPCVGLGADAAKVAMRALLLVLLLGTVCSLCVEFTEDAHDACSDFVMDDRLVVFANDVDTKLLQQRPVA